MRTNTLPINKHTHSLNKRKVKLQIDKPNTKANINLNLLNGISSLKFNGRKKAHPSKLKTHGSYCAYSHAQVLKPGKIEEIKDTLLESNGMNLINKVKSLKKI